MLDIKNFLANLPHQPGIYQMLDEKGAVIYVGKARDLKKRLASYFSNKVKDLKTQHLVRHIQDIDITVTHNENEAILLECNLIKKHKPRYNVLLRDDKSFPYILITQDELFPRIDFYRGTRKKNGLFFGPYPDSSAVRETIHLLQKLFQLRTCEDSFYKRRTRPCLQYQIGRCAGPCVGLITAEAYQQNIRHAVLFLEGKNNLLIEELQKKMAQASHELNYEYARDLRNQISRLRQIQAQQCIDVATGNADIIGFALQSGACCIQLLSIRGGRILGSRAYFPTIPAHSYAEEIINAFLEQHYLGHRAQWDNIPKEIIIDRVIPESAILSKVLAEQVHFKVKIIHPLQGEKKKWLTMACASAKQSLMTRLFSKSNMLQRLLALQNAFSFKKLPERIECFDISHTQGEATVASCVVFDQNGPLKSAYRRFNITGITPGDDTAAMRQVVSRRFKHLQKDNAQLPDLVLIDGGLTQLTAAVEALAELAIHDVSLVGVAKGAARKSGHETFHQMDQTPFQLPADSFASHLIQQIRDEAHRFAITAHRLKRDKSRRQSSLETIPGIGAARRRELLRHFGGIQAINHASLEELRKVPGINRSLAERIFAVLHDATI